jgi:hypothetical protein
MIYYFKKEPNCIYNITRIFLSDDRNNLQNKSQRYLHIKNILKDVSNEFRNYKFSVLYLKDYHIISDDSLEGITTYTNIDILHSEATDGGLQIQVHKVLADMYKVHVKMNELSEKQFKTSGIVYCEVKLNFDGGFNAYTTMLLTPLN